jgi:UDP-N-acetylmuramate--alanine ligase
VALTGAIPIPAEHKVFVPSWEDVPGEVVRRAREGDVVVTMGAPPISLMGEELIEALTRRVSGDDLDATYAPRHSKSAD